MSTFHAPPQVGPDEGKSHGYFGSLLFRLAERTSASPYPDHGGGRDGEERGREEQMQTVRALRSAAARALDRALHLGFDAPSLLHTRGSLAMEMGDPQLAVRLLEAALDRNKGSQGATSGGNDITLSDLNCLSSVVVVVDA